MQEKEPKAKRTSPHLNKPMKLSPALQDVLGAKELSRPEVMKKIWEYIKAHNRQDPTNGRMIIPDDKLAKVFGSKEPINMMKMPGLLNKHLS